MFEALRLNGTGMGVHKDWMDAISDNIANVNTVSRTSEAAFQARYVIAEAIENGGVGGGVRNAGIELSNAEGRLAYAPDHPLADANGMIRLPVVDMAEQMSTMIMAQRGYQANISALDRVRQSYQAAIQMGRG